MLFLFQLLLILFVLFAIFNVFRRRSEGLLGLKGSIFWVLFWIAAGVIVIWPNGVQKIADYIGIGRGADLVIYVSIAVVFFILFKLNVKVEGLKRDLTRVVRDESIHTLKRDNKVK